MSGWGIHDWAGLAILALFIYLGVSTLLRPPQPGRSWWTIERFNGPVLIFIGVTNLRDPGHPTRNVWLMVPIGSLILAFAFWFLLIDPLSTARRQREHEAALASLAAHEATYSDVTLAAERRELEATAPVLTTPKERVRAAAIAALFGGALLALGLTAARP